MAPDRPLDNIVLARMKKFAAMNKLKKAALLVIAKSLNPDEIKGLQQLFRSIDGDNSGTITVDELRTAMRSLDAKLNVRVPLRGFVMWPPLASMPLQHHMCTKCICLLETL